MDGIQDLGLRIVQAARLAVAVHLYESVARITETPEGEPADRAARQILRRQIEAGGAGPLVDHGSDDDDAAAVHQQHKHVSRLGDLVTDDEWDGLMGYDGERDEDPDPEVVDR